MVPFYSSRVPNPRSCTNPGDEGFAFVHFTSISSNLCPAYKTLPEELPGLSNWPTQKVRQFSAVWKCYIYIGSDSLNHIFCLGKDTLQTIAPPVTEIRVTFFHVKGPLFSVADFFTPIPVCICLWGEGFQLVQFSFDIFFRFFFLISPSALATPIPVSYLSARRRIDFL